MSTTQKMEITRKPSKLSFILNTKERKNLEPIEYDNMTRFCESTIPNSIKEVATEHLKDFLAKFPVIYSNGYLDDHSTMMREYIAEQLPKYTWHKNSSQRPFDIYSVDGLISIENKTNFVKGNKKTKNFASNNKLVMNATVYPEKAKVRDVVPKRLHKNYDEATLEKFMDVIVLIIDKDKKTNMLVRYMIVDGSYWGIDYDIYLGIRNLYKQANDPEIKRIFLDAINKKYPENRYVSDTLEGKLPHINLDLRKLITVTNPTRELI
jgi:hypothetical protein